MTGTAFIPDATNLLQTLLAVSVLLAIVLLVRRPVARHFGAGVAYALWAIPLARLVLPPLHMPFSVMPFLRWPSVAADKPEPLPVTAFAAVSDRAEPVVAVTPPAPAVVHPAPLTDAMPEGWISSESLADMATTMVLPGLLFLWAGGALACLGLSLWRQHVFMQVVKLEAMPVSPHLERVARQTGAQVGLKRLPVIAASLISSGPLVTGLFRPVVLLPAWFETDYDDVQQRAALAHELTHVRRGDLWALQLAELLVACLWFNPLAHYARRAFRIDQEAACDADVLKTGTASPYAYGATLVKAVKSAAREHLPAAAGLPLTHALKERLNRMKAPAPSRARRLAGSAAATVLGIAALAATSSVTASAGEGPSRDLEIADGAVYLHGERIGDRQIIVLGEPFRDLVPDPQLDDEIARLSTEIARDGAKISELTADLSAMGRAFALSPEDEAEFRALMEELNDLPMTFEFDGDVTFSFDGDMSDEDWEAWGEKWGAWGEMVGARAEQWAARQEARAAALEARAEAVEDALDPEFDRLSAELEADIEAKSEELEALIEEAFGEEFEARIEAAADAIDSLVEECRDADLEDGQTRVMVRSFKLPDGTPRKVKIACVKGDVTALRSARTLAAIESDSSLCQVEKQSFRDQVREGTELEGAER